MVLDTLYNPFDSVSFLTDTAYRISKDTKPDIESTTLITHLDEKHLYALGSFSTKERQSLYYFPLAYTDSFLKISLHNTTELFRGLEEINIEGLAFTGTSFIMANRANYSNRSNHLIISNELNPSAENLYSVIELILDTSTVKGISGLYYHLERDILFFTASEEETNNAFEDGVIKDSYLGWISSFSDKQDNKKVSADQLIKLSDVDRAFTSQKIESLCVQDVRRDHFTLHMVADNDKGQSRIFKMILKL